MSTAERSPLTAEQRARLGRRAQWLAAASVTYNVVEAVIAVGAGLVAGSVALIGFGLDSVVEVSSGLIILWQFRHRIPESRERTALRLIGLSFLALAAYVTYESVAALVTGAVADHSPVGIGLAVASLLVMPALSRAQRRTGRALQSSTVVADGTQTLLCAWLSAALLAGLLLNVTLGWSWADPAAALVIAAVAAREGVLAWRGDNCCDTGDSHDHDHVRNRSDPRSDRGCTDGCCVPATGQRRDAPVACSLDGPDQADRAAAWLTAVDGAATAPIDDGLRITVPLDRLAAITELAAAEQQCCPFLDFRIHLDHDVVHLEVRAPAAAADQLAGLFVAAR